MNYDNTKMIRVFQTAGNILQNITEMSVPRGKFSASQLDSLRKAYEKINTVDPNSPAAKRMFELLDSLSKDQLKQVIDAKIKFLSKLAFRRFNRMQNPSKYPSDKLGDKITESSFTTEDEVLEESADDTKFANLTKEVLAKGTYLGHDKKFGRKWWDHKGYLYGMHPDGKHVFNNGSVKVPMNQKIIRGLVRE